MEGRQDHVPDSATAGAERDQELAETLDDIERRVAKEREAEDVPGNAAERAETEQIEGEDQAPE